MKRQIRRGVFETNSSSTHAICISKNSDYTKKGFVDFRTGEFGWDFDVYNDVGSKASYLITAIYSQDQEYAEEKIERLKLLLGVNQIDYDIPKPTVSSYEYRDKTIYYYDIDGYIDHSGETKEFIETVLSDGETLMRYLFGDSFIVTGNDNDDEFYDYMYEDYSLKKEFENYDIVHKGN